MTPKVEWGFARLRGRTMRIRAASVMIRSEVAIIRGNELIALGGLC